MTDLIASLPKAELHCHLEGTVAPDVAQTLAARHGMDISSIIKPDGTYQWDTFDDFLKVYDVMAQVIRTPEDYYDILKIYYDRAAAQGLVYGEMFISSDHPAHVGISYDTFMETLNAAADDILSEHGVEVRFVLHVVRHYGTEMATAVAELAEHHPKKRVTGFGIAGDEAHLNHKDFAHAFEAARGAGLRCTAHAGEHLGPQSVEDVITHLKAERVGHGVRAMESPETVAMLKDTGTVLEVCPSSNVCLGVAPSIETHQLRGLHEAGVAVTLNSDDPPFFFTDIGQEYALAAQHHGFDPKGLLDITRRAITAGFCEEETKAAALAKVDAWAQEHLT